MYDEDSLFSDKELKGLYSIEEDEDLDRRLEEVLEDESDRGDIELAKKHFSLGIRAIGGKDYDEAVRNFQIAFNNDPNSEYATTLGRAFLGLNRLEDALLSLEKALELHSGNQEARVALSSAHLSMGDKALLSDGVDDIGIAAEHYGRAADLDPKNNEANGKLNFTSENARFQREVRTGNPSVYLGVRPKITEDTIRRTAEKFLREEEGLVHHLRPNFAAFDFDERELNERARRLLEETVEERKEDYSGSSFSNIRLLDDKLDRASDDVMSDWASGDSMRLRFSVSSIIVKGPHSELRPYQLSSSRAEDLSQGYSRHDLEISSEEANRRLVRLEKWKGRTIREVKGKPDPSRRVYYFENYIVPFEATLSSSVARPIQFTYGFMQYGLVAERLSFNFDVKVSGKLLYDGWNGELIGNESCGARVKFSGVKWDRYRVISSPKGQFLSDILKPMLIGGVPSGLIGGCVEGCHNLITNRSDHELLGGMLILAAGIGFLIGLNKYLFRDSSDIEEIHYERLNSLSYRD